MNHHPNTIEAYESIKRNGSLSAARFAAYEAIFQHGPVTRNELDRIIAPGAANPSYSRRLVELERLGVIERVGSRKDKITGFVCDEWAASGRLPDPAAILKSKRRPTSTEISVALEELRQIARSGVKFSSTLISVCQWLGGRR